MDENSNVIEKTADGGETVAELKSIAKKQLFWQRISTACIAGMLLVVIIVALNVVPKVSVTLSHINDVALKAQESLDKVDQMTASLESASKDLSNLVDENGEALSAAIKAMTDVDYDGLNQAIKDLQDTVGPMANFMSKFH